MQQKTSIVYVEVWNRVLPASVEDRDFILNGVKDGFKLSVIYGPHLTRPHFAFAVLWKNRSN
jgi:hypothetical protein